MQGGGGGPVQFLIAELGFDVTNIDLSIAEPNISYKNRYQITYNILPSFKSTSYNDFLKANRNIRSGQTVVKNIIKKSWLYKLWSAKQYSQKHEQWRKTQELESARIGHIKWFRANLCNMQEVMDNTFDAVVSLSAMEHIPYKSLQAALNEIKRVLKPDARWAVTTSGTEKDKTWFHEPSQGNCFSSTDLEKIFGAKPEGEQTRRKYCKNIKTAVT